MTDEDRKEKQRAASRRWYAANREKARAYHEKWKAANRETELAKQRERANQKYKDNPEVYKARRRAYYDNNREAIRERRSRPEYKAKVYISETARRAALKGLVCTINEEWLLPKLLAGACEASGATFYFGPGRSPWTPTLDQITPGGGYTPGNTRVVCWIYNSAKSFFTDDDVLTLARAVVARAEQQ